MICKSWRTCGVLASTIISNYDANLFVCMKLRLCLCRAAQAALYFKKGIDDAASEWAQHHAKRWLDTSGKVR